MVKSARPPSTVKVRNGCPTAASTTASQTQMLVATTTPSQAPSRSESCLRAIERPPSYGEPPSRSEEHTSELQSRLHLVCRLLLEKKKKKYDVCSRLPTN